MFKNLLSSLSSFFKPTPVIHYCNLCNKSFEGNSALDLAEMCETEHFEDIKNPVSQESMIKLFKKHFPESKEYFKKDSIMARIAKPNEVVNTIIDNVIKDTAIASELDVVIKRCQGDEYIISYEEFKKLYKVDYPVTYVYREYNSCVKCFAFEYKGEMIAFENNSGEAFFVKSGDYLAIPDTTLSSVYLIEARDFLENYELIQK